MKRWRRGALAALLCVLTLALALSPARAGTVYFMAVNDVPLDLSASNMPFVSGGLLYVPYTMFSSNVTGVNLGVFAVYNSSQGRALVYSNRKQLIFDMQENKTYDMDGNTYNERAMRRNSTVYLPIARVCGVFSELVSYSCCDTPYGQLVRVKNDAVVLGDEAFVAAADNKLSESLAQYLESQPSAGPGGSSAPSSTPSESPEPTGGGAGVYLAFTLGGGEEDWREGLELTLKGLAAQGRVGLFFLTPEQLAQEDDLVRRLSGLGHLVGADISQEDPAAALDEWSRAKAYLAQAARCRPAAALCEELDKEGLAGMEQAGVVCWRTSVDGRALKGTAGSRVSTLLRRLAPGGSARNYLLLDAAAGETLEGVLAGLADADFQLRPPTPPDL